MWKTCRWKGVSLIDFPLNSAGIYLNTDNTMVLYWRTHRLVFLSGDCHLGILLWWDELPHILRATFPWRQITLDQQIINIDRLIQCWFYVYSWSLPGGSFISSHHLGQSTPPFLPYFHMCACICGRYVFLCCLSCGRTSNSFFRVSFHLNTT